MNSLQKVLVFTLVAGTAAACHSVQMVKRGTIPPGAEIAVVGFRDCVLSDQPDCNGSGSSASSIFARVFALRSRYPAVPVSRPVAATAEFTDAAAVALAKKAGHKYVMNGEVSDFFNATPMPFVRRQDRVALAVRILDVQTGQVVVFFSDRFESGPMGSAEDLVEDIAEQVAERL